MSLEELLNTPVTTASGSQEDRVTASANVYSISGSEISARGFHSLEEVLRTVPGLFIANDHVFSSLGVRGVAGGFQAGTRIVKVMIDGYPVNFRPGLTAFLGPEYIPFDSIERIEVVKGPLSALYGANAFLATVNIITKNPFRSDSKVSLRFTQRDKYSGVGMSLLASNGNPTAGALVALTMERADRSGLSLQHTFAGQDTLGLDFDSKSEDDLAQPVGAYLKLHYSRPNSIGSFVLQGGFQRFDRGAEFQLNSVLTHHSRVTLHNYWASIQHTISIYDDKFFFRSRVGFSSGEPTDEAALYLTNNYDYYFKPNYGYNAVTGLAEVLYRPIEKIQLKLGVDLEYAEERILFYTKVFNRTEGDKRSLDEVDLIRSTSSRSQIQKMVGTFIQVETRPLPLLPKLRLTGNFRLDHGEFGPVLDPLKYSWRGALIYPWTADLVTKVIGGRAYQSPSGVLLFSEGDFGNTNNVLGSEVFPDWPQLNPQTVDSVELWSSAHLTKMFFVEGSFFYQILRDAIEFVQYGPYVVAINRGDREALGGELTAHFKYKMLHVYFSFSGLVPLSSSELSLLTDADSNATETFPNWSIFTGLDLQIWKHLYGIAELRWFAERGTSQSNGYYNNLTRYDLEDYGVLNVTLGARELKLINKSMPTTILLSVRNTLSRTYSEPGFGGIDVPQHGWSLFLEVKQTL